MKALYPKIFTYALNAYLDAQIAEEIVVYIKSNGKAFATQKTIAQQRAQKLIQSAPHERFSQNMSYFIGLAYTLYYVNGLADILYADLFWFFFLSKHKKRLKNHYKLAIEDFRKQFSTKHQFEEFVSQPTMIFAYWPLLLSNSWKWVDDFAQKRCLYTRKLHKHDLQKASVEVQNQNGANNRSIANILRNDSVSIDPKVIAIRNAAKQVAIKSFAEKSAKTQYAAANWDKFYKFIISH